MKKLLFLLLLIPFLAKAQDPNKYNLNGTPILLDNAKMGKYFYLPAYPRADTTGGSDTGRLVRIGINTWEKMGTSWRKFGSGSGGLSVTGNGVNKLFGDTVALGGNIDYLTNITARSNLFAGSPNTSILYTNRPPDSMFSSSAKMHTGAKGLQDGSYAPSMILMESHLREDWGDRNLGISYGGPLTIARYNWFDSVSSHYDNGSNNMVIPYQGLNVESQFFPPKGLTGLYSTQFGQAPAAVVGSVAIGADWGYNFQTKSNLPLWATPLAGEFHVDFNRNLAYDRVRSISGNGVSIIDINYRARQGSISPTSVATGSVINKIMGIQIFGNTNWDIHTGGATKAQILAVSKIDTVPAIYIHPQYQPFNEVANGYGIFHRGQWDMDYIEGQLTIGNQVPSTPTAGRQPRLWINNFDPITIAATANVGIKSISDRAIDPGTYGTSGGIEEYAEHTFYGGVGLSNPVTYINGNAGSDFFRIEKVFYRNSGTATVTAGTSPLLSLAAASIFTGSSGNGAVTINGWSSGLNIGLKANQTGTKHLDNFAFLNIGTRQIGGTADIANAVGVYINPFKGATGFTGSGYGIYQEGTLDTNYFGGINRIANIQRQFLDTTNYKLMAVDVKGIVKKIDWPVAGGIGSTTFTALTDAPSSYVGQALKGVRVNAAATALEFYTPGGGGSGTVNTGTQNRLGYYASTADIISQLAAITAGRALVSDANGLPVAATPTTAEINFVSGVTSAIQTQLNGKASSSHTHNTSDITAGLLPVARGGLNLGSAVLNSIPYASSTSGYASIPVNSTSSMMAYTQVSGNAPTLTEVLNATENSPRQNDVYAYNAALGLTNRSGAFSDNSIRLQQAMGNVILAQSIDPFTATTGNSLSNQVLKGVAVWLDADAIISAVTFVQNTTGAFTANGTNSIALYKDVNGVATKVAETANTGTLFQQAAGTYKVTNFATPYDADEGLYYICFLYNESVQTTAPAIAHGTAGFGSNTGLATQVFTNGRKMAFVLTGQTSMPATFNMSATTASTTYPFAQLK